MSELFHIREQLYLQQTAKCLIRLDGNCSGTFIIITRTINI